MFWAANGDYFGHIIQISTSPGDHQSANGGATSVADDVITIPITREVEGSTFYPIFSLRNTSIEVNFGDGPFPLRYINKVRQINTIE